MYIIISLYIILNITLYINIVAVSDRPPILDHFKFIKILISIVNLYINSFTNISISLFILYNLYNIF